MIDDTKVLIACAQKSFFELELLKYGDILEFDEMDFRGNRRSP
jgi:hypothetical protein